MTRILLVRHGHVDGIKPERFRGRADLPLTALGEAQAAAVARRVASHWRVAGIYTSPARRCLATAAAISGACASACPVCRGIATVSLIEPHVTHDGWEIHT